MNVCGYYRNETGSLSVIKVTNVKDCDEALLGVSDYLLENKLQNTSPVFLLLQGGRIDA